jgi:hypothetical protein
MRTILRALTTGKYILLAVVAALTLATASVAVAGSGVGGVFNLGQTNTVNAITKLVGSVTGASLVVDNNSTGTGATALDLQVEPGKTPMKVNSTTKVANLNSDQVDGKGANALLRVASFTGASPLATGTSNGTVATTTINAPASGFLVITAGSDLSNLEESAVVGCRILVDNVYGSGSQRYMRLNASQGHVNEEEDCSTNAVVPVQAGTHTVVLNADNDAPHTKFGETALSAIYVPFNGTGATP